MMEQPDQWPRQVISIENKLDIATKITRRPTKSSTVNPTPSVLADWEVSWVKENTAAPNLQEPKPNLKIAEDDLSGIVLSLQRF
jgi:hypothetical protein